VEFGSEARAVAAQAALPSSWHSRVVAGATRSALLDALERWR
jgi:hypothetical protein